MKKLVYTSMLFLSAMAAKAQAPAIVFLHADAYVDTYEFMTLRRSNLTTMSTTDAGICTNGTFRTNEGFVQDYNNPGLADVPAGTIIQVRYDNTGTPDYTVVDGRGLVIANTNQLNQANTNPPGEQVIAFTGTAAGGVNCAGTGNNTFVSGINWGNAGWTSGATDAASSKAPGSATDIAIPGTTSKVSYTGNVLGNEAALISNITNPTNWTGVTNGDGIFALKNILFDESNYTTGSAVVTPAQTSVILDLTGLSFDNTTVDTRYVVIISAGPAQPPVDRYTCYTGIAPNISGAPTVAIGVTGQTANDFCGTAIPGLGQIVYLDYTLPSSLTISGLAQNTSYNFSVAAVNGNGYTANFSSVAYSSTFTTQNPIVDNTEVNFSVTPGDNIENIGLVGVVLSITNPSQSAATTVEVQITGGNGSAADINNYTTQTITFPAGSNALQPLSITITDDGLFEPYETINFSIRNISGGQGTAFIGADSTFVLGIIDNDIPNVVINEIHYNPSEASGSPDAQYEFIELYNGEPVSFDLAGYHFTQGVDFTFPANSIINPGQYIIVAIDAATYSGQGYDVYQWNNGSDLDNFGETIQFKTVGDLLVDVVTYDEVLPWPTAANGTGPSLELIDEPLDNALPQNWRANGPKNGTPGHVNTPLGLNENKIGRFVSINGFGNQIYLNVDKQFTDNYTVNIIDLAGRNLGTYQNLSGSATLTTTLPSGLFIVQCVGNSEILNKKVVLGY